MSRHFEIRILPRERPFDTSLLVVPASLPCIDFIDERVTVREATIKTLAVKNANLDFRHVQPTGVLWGVVKDYASQQFLRRPDAEHLLEALVEVGVQVVQHEMDTPRRWVNLFQQILDKSHEVRLGAMIGNLHCPSSSLGLDCNKQVAGATPHILIIHSQGCPRLHRQGLASIFQHLLALLVQANDRLSRSKRAGVQPADRTSAAGTLPSVCRCTTSACATV